MENILKFKTQSDAENSIEFKSNEWVRLTLHNGIFSLEMVNLGPCVCGQKLIRINTKKV